MIFIGVGSNLGDRWAALSAAWLQLEAAGIHVNASSPIYETKPWGNPHQPPYLNAIWEVHTTLSPEALLEQLQEVEKALGRPTHLRTRWSARVIDLDLLVYGTEARHTEKLILPHPWIPYRAFVLGPWNDLAPYFYLPTWQATVGELWARCGAWDWGYRVVPPNHLPLPPIPSPLIPPAGRSS